MKKVISGLFICAALVAFASCKKEKKINCTDAITSFNEKLSAYMTDGSAENCQALKAASGSLDQSCFASLNAQAKEIIESLSDCSPE